MYQNQNVKRCSEDSTDGSLEPQHGAAESQASFPLVTTLLTHLADGGISWEAVEIPRPGSTFTRSLVRLTLHGPFSENLRWGCEGLMQTFLQSYTTASLQNAPEAQSESAPE